MPASAQLDEEGPPDLVDEEPPGLEEGEEEPLEEPPGLEQREEALPKKRRCRFKQADAKYEAIGKDYLAPGPRVMRLPLILGAIIAALSSSKFLCAPHSTTLERTHVLEVLAGVGTVWG